MSDDQEPADAVLYNCTAMMLEKDYFSSYGNSSHVWSLNRTELEDLVDNMVTDLNAMTSPMQQVTLRQLFSDCVFPPSRRYDMVWWQKLVWTSVFAVMLLVATGGNTIVMWIVLGE